MWDYAVWLYGEPGVAAACLALQDQAGTDVNLLLFAAWLGATGRAPSPQVLAAAREMAEEWQDRVVRPLRIVRRELKPRLAAIDPMLRAPLSTTRQQLAQVELELERAELTMLETLIAGLEVGPGDAELALSALHTLAPLSAEHMPALSVVLAASFPGHGPAMPATAATQSPKG